MKKIGCKVFLCLFCVFFLLGCKQEDYAIHQGLIKKGKASIVGNYAYFEGSKEYILDLAHGIYEFQIRGTTKQGKLTIWIDDILCFDSEKEDTWSESREIVPDQKIKVRIEGDKHEGDFDFVWERQGKIGRIF